MIHNKKGLSTVITTLIIILLVLVAVGIIWVVVRGVIDQGADQIDTSSACPLIDLRITGQSGCGVAGSCTVDIERKSGGRDIDGVVSVVSSDSSSSTPLYTYGNIPQLGNQQVNANGIASGNVVRVAAVFNDSQGNPQACPNSAEWNF